MIELIRGKKVMVVGMARSGLASARLLSEAGAARIIVTDNKEAAALESELKKLKKIPGTEAFTGGNPEALVTEDLALIVKSPGVAPHLPLLKKAGGLKVPVISEIELGYAFLKAPLVGVTGTNGKTTTTALICAMLQEAGFNPVVAAGNIGNPLSSLAQGFSAQGMVVAELSSFQLNDIKNFRPLVALFLNFAEDHLDYHLSMENYFRAKSRITENQKATDYLVLNAADKTVKALAEKSKATVLMFDQAPVEKGAGVAGGWITLFNPGSKPQKVCPVEELKLPGAHNLENALGAAAAAFAAGADPLAIGRALKSFKPVAHRLEPVAQIDGVDYINDSKGTNPGATTRALEAFAGRKLILIAGGKDKKADFTELAAKVKASAEKVILFGETKDQLSAALLSQGFNNYQLVKDLAEAVKEARAFAKKGAVVLLSPACASWDMFKDFEERGNLFKELVLAQKPRLAGKEEG